jgi:hypothetical protein
LLQWQPRQAREGALRPSILSQLLLHLTDREARRLALAFNSFSIASSRTWEQNVTTDPSLNFQFFLSCFMFPPAGILSAMPLGNLSILSQLLQELSPRLRALAEVSGLSILSQLLPPGRSSGLLAKNTTFQFFPSCFPSRSRLCAGLRRPFNSFPVASRGLPARTTALAEALLTFNSFPVASGDGT